MRNVIKLQAVQIMPSTIQDGEKITMGQMDAPPQKIMFNEYWLLVQLANNNLLEISMNCFHRIIER